ncbi:HD domain-containing protein [Paenibacillus sp. CN-4]|uniref:HD domain-containing protein n=1 Tax=Paenibacillus nanchangensis TaxID=3348343 RepID=UPI00397CC0BF
MNEQMNEQELIRQAESYVKTRLEHETTGHDWWHIARVTALAVRIAGEEGADVLVCRLAALFHDLADEKIVPSKAEGLAQIAEWLNAHGVLEADIRHITEIIAEMSFGGGHGRPMRTIEGRVVQDADRLDAIGAIGIARTFTYNGSKGHKMHEPGRPPREQMTEEQYRKEPNTAVNHFYEKLLKLKDRMNTATGKRLAEGRHAMMESFLDRFYREWEGEL